MTIWDRIGLATFYAFLSIPVLGFVFALAALFHLLPGDWYTAHD